MNLCVELKISVFPCKYCVLSFNVNNCNFFSALCCQIKPEILFEDCNMEQLQKAPLPAWLQPLLASKFFEQCEGHSNERKNEENHFCMDCSCRLCPNCVTEHTKNGGTHNLLQIRHYVHSDVVRVNDVFKLLDIAKIQVYISFFQEKKLNFCFRSN